MPGLAHERERAVVARDHDAARAHLDDLLEREHEVLRRLELEADELLGLHLVGHDEVGLAAEPEPQRLALGVEHREDLLAARLAQRRRVPVLGHLARAGCRRARPPRCRPAGSCRTTRTSRARPGGRSARTRRPRSRPASPPGRARSCSSATRRRCARTGGRSRRRSGPRRSCRRRGRRPAPSRRPADRRARSARATLMPLPPACRSPGAQRWRRPICRFATRRVLSIAALSVTVRNMVCAARAALETLTRLCVKQQLRELPETRAQPRHERRRPAAARDRPPAARARARRGRCVSST